MYSALSRLEALERRSDFYAGLAVPQAHERARRRKVAETWVKRALEHNRLAQRPAALRCLVRAARVSPVSVPRVLRDRRRGRAGTTRSGLR